MVHTVDEYLRSLKGEGRQWVDEYVRFMRGRFPEASEGISYQVPTFLLGNAYVAFSASENHFTFHTRSGEWLAHLKALIPNARFAKYTVKIPFSCVEAKPLLYAACCGILAQGGPAAPPSVPS